MTEQCVTSRAECRSDGLGDTRCLCEEGGEIYDNTTDTCLACRSNYFIPVIAIFRFITYMYKLLFCFAIVKFTVVFRLCIKQLTIYN